jgi:hypothetical protein
VKTRPSADSAPAIADLRQLHGSLNLAVGHAEEAYGTFNLPQARCPTRAELAGLFEETTTVSLALEAFLDGLDRYLGNEGAAPATNRLSPEEAGALLAELEPEPKQAAGLRSHFPPAWHPGLPRGASAIGRLAGFYGYVVSVNNALHDKRIHGSFVWREALALWETFVSFGGTSAAGGLLARLDQISKLPGQRTASRTTKYYPWDRQDVAELRRIADRAAFLHHGTDEEVENAARDNWCTIIDDWLRAGPEVGRTGGEMMASWIDQVPAPDEAIKERLRRLSTLDYVPELARKKALALAK